jgi:hypothetical protein
MLISNDNSSNSSAWDIQNSNEETITNVIAQKPDKIRELLAEATGVKIEESLITQTTQPTYSISYNDQSVEERLKTIFHLPTNEALKGGKHIKEKYSHVI